MKLLADSLASLLLHIRQHGTSTRYFTGGAIDASVSPETDVHFPFFFFEPLFYLPLFSSNTIFYWEEDPGMNCC